MELCVLQANLRGSMTYSPLWIAAIATVSLAPTLSGAIGSASSIRALLSSADSVVVVRIEAGQAVTGVVDAIIAVEEVIRGLVKTGDRLTLRWEDPPSARFSRQIEGGRGLFFLKRRGDGGYEILPAVGDSASLRPPTISFRTHSGQWSSRLRADLIQIRCFLPLHGQPAWRPKDTREEEFPSIWPTSSRGQCELRS